jgi:hypothetical protein
MLAVWNIIFIELDIETSAQRLKELNPRLGAYGLLRA